VAGPLGRHLYLRHSALSGLRAIGVDVSEPWIKRAVGWLRSVQNSDGGGANLPRRQGSALKGNGTSTPSQTAWALIGLFAGEDALSENAMRGVPSSRNCRTTTGGGKTAGLPAPVSRTNSISAAICTLITFI